MTKTDKHYVISYDAGFNEPYGAAWLDELGRDRRGGENFKFFATRAECIEHVNRHTRFNPVLLCEDTPELETA